MRHVGGIAQFETIRTGPKLYYREGSQPNGKQHTVGAVVSHQSSAFYRPVFNSCLNCPYPLTCLICYSSSQCDTNSTKALKVRSVGKLNIVIKEILVGMRPKAHFIVFLGLQFDIIIDEITAKYVALQEEIVILS